MGHQFSADWQCLIFTAVRNVRVRRLPLTLHNVTPGIFHGALILNVHWTRIIIFYNGSLAACYSVIASFHICYLALLHHFYSTVVEQLRREAKEWKGQRERPRHSKNTFSEELWAKNHHHYDLLRFVASQRTKIVIAYFAIGTKRSFGWVYHDYGQDYGLAKNNLKQQRVRWREYKRIQLKSVWNFIRNTSITWMREASKQSGSSLIFFSHDSPLKLNICLFSKTLLKSNSDRVLWFH